MRHHLIHWFGIHDRCRPARCKHAADWCNRIESEYRMQDYINSRKDLT